MEEELSLSLLYKIWLKSPVDESWIAKFGEKMGRETKGEFGGGALIFITFHVINKLM